MPTNRPRHMITESDRLAHALGTAAQVWPEVGGEKSVLLRRIIDAGMDAVEKKAAAKDQSHRNAVSQAAGSLSGIWPKGWRESLRDEWPT
jgi:hypothetical protein